MSAKKKTIIAIILLSITLIVGFIFYGLYLMFDEDKYGDLVYVKEKAEDGDLILKCSKEYFSNKEYEFDEIGIIEKSFGNVYVWDNKNTLKKSLFDWCERQNAQKVIILRPKGKVKTKKISKIEGEYNYLLNSTEYEKITETL
ncbi:hypothetical protein [Flavobacterium sp. NRK F7]|uniref:hypothetical protein n=1 Tax=Flavobacterium sp. NRK F7 TaxID=2954930 RepID=UPI002091E351|nr:hypothetical protein [Flavobacterium sp. NRK F7]MCO6164070.1 hypothetical protein [Flavobacterium sp. NRK F7]